MRGLFRYPALGLLAAAIFGAGLSGCSSEVDVYVPVPVPEFENQVRLEVAWSSSVGSGVGRFYSALHPAFDVERVYAASRNGDVYAFDKKDGSRLWHLDLDDEDENDDRRSARISGGITVREDFDTSLVLLASENGWVYAVDGVNGELLWKHFTGEEILTAPAADGDRVFVLSSHGQLFALNAQDGSRLWATGDDSAQFAVRGDSAPVPVQGAVVFYGTSDGKLNIVNQERGVLLNQIKVGVPHGSTRLARLNDVNASPVVISDELYVIALNGQFQGLSLQNPTRPMWVRQYSSVATPAYDLSDIAITDQSGHVYAVIRTDGSERWSNTRLTYRNVTGPAYAGSYVVVGDYEGYLYWLDSATGDFRAKLQLNSSGIYTAPVADDDTVYVVTRNGNLYAVREKRDSGDQD